MSRNAANAHNKTQTCLTKSKGTKKKKESTCKEKIAHTTSRRRRIEGVKVCVCVCKNTGVSIPMYRIQVPEPDQDVERGE